MSNKHVIIPYNDYISYKIGNLFTEIFDNKGNLIKYVDDLDEERIKQYCKGFFDGGYEPRKGCEHCKAPYGTWLKETMLNKYCSNCGRKL